MGIHSDKGTGLTLSQDFFGRSMTAGHWFCCSSPTAAGGGVEVRRWEHRLDCNALVHALSSLQPRRQGKPGTAPYYLNWTVWYPKTFRSWPSNWGLGQCFIWTYSRSNPVHYSTKCILKLFFLEIKTNFILKYSSVWFCCVGVARNLNLDESNTLTLLQ